MSEPLTQYSEKRNVSTVKEPSPISSEMGDEVRSESVAELVKTLVINQEQVNHLLS